MPSKMRSLVLAALALMISTQGLAAQVTDAAAEDHLAHRRWIDAQNAYESLLAQGRTYDRLMGLGLALYHQQESSRSKGLFQEAAAAAPDRSEPYYYQGACDERRAYAEQEQGRTLQSRLFFADAVLNYRSAAKRATDAFDAHYRAAEVLLATDHPDEAALEARLALEVRPQDPYARGILATSLYLEEDYKGFLEILEPLLAERPHDLGLWTKKIQALLAADRFQESLALLRDLADPQRFGEYGDIYRPFEAALRTPAEKQAYLDVLQTLVKTWPKGFQHRYRLGVFLGTMDDVKGAEAAFESALALRPAEPYSLAAHAHLLALDGRLDEALAEMHQALEEGPALTEVQRRAGILVSRLIEGSRHGDALALHRRLLDANPEDPAVRRNHAILLKDAGRPEAAVAQLEELVKIEELNLSERAGLMNDLALIQKGMGKAKLAEASLREALEYDDESLDALENLGLMLLEDGRVAEGRAFLELCVNLSFERGISRERAGYYLRDPERARPADKP
ncbi:MAG: tetratricopeptide repeat protein [Planctomycetes bacterium]|nr:tetratricopeptide repeat protein [Planctomycetota bacterium]